MSVLSIIEDKNSEALGLLSSILTMVVVDCREVIFRAYYLEECVFWYKFAIDQASLYVQGQE